jgi:hypothetical protein
MKRKTLLFLFSALLVATAARAQNNQTTPPVRSGIEDDPQFKRLDPDSQKLVKQIMDNVENAAAAEKASIAAGQTASAAQTATAKAGTATPKAQGGCPATPAKKPRFRIPKALQDAVNSGKLGDLTGINVDPNAKKDTPKDATGKLCPPAPQAAPKPAAK